VENVNARQKLTLANKVRRHFGDDLSNLTIALWGLAFKPNTDDVREALAFVFIDTVTSLGATVQAYDPKAADNSRRHYAGNARVQIVEDQYDALENADCLVICTEWWQFRSPDFDIVLQKLDYKVVFDGRNLYNPASMAKLGERYFLQGPEAAPPGHSRAHPPGQGRLPARDQRHARQRGVRRGGAVRDPFRAGGEVTSEGQSYALLRAAWMRDEATFRKVLTWTEATMKRDDGLYSWRWLPEGGGRIADYNTAADADVDIAFALIIAAQAFEDPGLLERAREIAVALRTGCRMPLPRGWCLAAGNWAVEERVYNPSYFAPYAYAYFHELDPEGGWLEARDAGYDLLPRILDLSAVHLAPDFVIVDRDGGVAPVTGKQGLDSDFSFDAMRTYWRVALDCLLLHAPRACADPLRTDAIAEIYARDGAIFSSYDLQGRPQSDIVSVSFYGGLLPSLRLFQPRLADALLRNQLSREALTPILDDPDRYFDCNWTWFGLAVENGLALRNTPGIADLRRILESRASGGES